MRVHDLADLLSATAAFSGLTGENCRHAASLFKELKLEPGEIVGFLGPNGAGKSTTVKMITGMLRANDGRVLFEGKDIREDMVAYRSVLGYVPEEAHLYSYLSGLE